MSPAIPVVTVHDFAEREPSARAQAAIAAATERENK